MDIQTTPDIFETVDRNTWKRSEHFQFFSSFKEPFFSVCAEVECTGLIRSCKEAGRSSTLSLWHGCLWAANQVDEFRYRIRDGVPVLYDKIHLSPTILRPDETFTIGFVPYLENESEFIAVAESALSEARETSGFALSDEARRVDLIHFSSLPWFRFTGLTHARPLANGESETKVSIGRFGEREGRYWLPISVTAHHGFVDGLHVARYFEFLESRWNSTSQ